MLHLHRALTLAESGGGAAVCAELTTAWQCAEDARMFFDGVNPTFAHEAIELRWEIEDAMGQFGCPPPHPRPPTRRRRRVGPPPAPATKIYLPSLAPPLCARRGGRGVRLWGTDI